MNGKVTIKTLKSMKERKEKISALTCYNYYLARILNEAGTDMLLVGDSLGMVEIGYDSTLPVTISDMLCYLKSVKRGNTRSLLVVDMPYMSYNFNRRETLANAGRLVKAGAEAVKIEGGSETRSTIRLLLDHNIPVMGHLGLTPQGINRLGGYRVQGRTQQEKDNLIREARKLESYGVFSLVLECVTDDCARQISRELSIPVIGIGSGKHCDGQILVLNDMLGLFPGKKPQFVKQYALLAHTIQQAVNRYCREVKKGSYPTKKYSYR
ncbi:MAG: 3-methyl-2-oxobutanoate hydroxymethyltransferase [Elusimicrobia bacterium]|nr:3-methyl-2-oxobutanoate hydroxymethyltransferase [Elusimicrobiota bacterium]